MSEVASYRTVIVIPSLAERTSVAANIIDNEPRAALLKRALELLAEDHGGKLVDLVEDCDGKQIPCLMGVSTPEFPRGIGTVVDKAGLVSFVYDAHGDASGMGRTLAGELSANYNAIAMRMALEAMDMEVGVTEVQGTRTHRHIEIVGRV